MPCECRSPVCAAPPYSRQDHTRRSTTATRLMLLVFPAKGPQIAAAAALQPEFLSGSETPQRAEKDRLRPRLSALLPEGRKLGRSCEQSSLAETTHAPD